MPTYPSLTGLDTTGRPQFFQYANRVFMVNGRDANRCCDGVAWTYAGIKKETSSPTVAAGAAGVLTGTYYYYAVPINKNKPTKLGSYVRGLPVKCLTSGVHGLALTSQQATVTVANTTVDTQVTHWWIYRNRAGYLNTGLEHSAQPEGFFYVGEITVGNTTLADNTADVNLQDDEIISFKQAQPPAMKYAAIYGDRAWYAQFDDITTGNCTVNATTTLIDFAGVTIPEGVVGAWFRKSGESTQYRIVARPTTSQIRLDRAFVGTLSGSAYFIFRYPWEIVASDWMDPEAGGFDGEAFRFRRELPAKERLTCHIPYRGMLVLFYNEGAYAISGESSPDFDSYRMSTEPVFTGLGCVGGMAAVEVGGILYFLSLRGPARWDGAGQPQVIPGLGDDFLTGLAPAQLANCTVGWANGRIRFAVPETGETCPSKVYLLDLATGTWWPETYNHPSCYLHDLDVTGKPACFHGAGNFIVQDDTGDQDLCDDADGTVQGTSTAYATTSLTDGAATFVTTGDGLKECYVHIFSATGTHKGSRKISSNTATQLTWATALAGQAVGDVYYIGSVWAYWRTKDFQPEDRLQHNEEVFLTLDKDTSHLTAVVRKTEYLDGTADDTQVVAVDELEKFPLYQRAQRYAMKFEIREPAVRIGIRTLALRSRVVEDDK
jgi:hypothetical protein